MLAAIIIIIVIASLIHVFSPLKRNVNEPFYILTDGYKISEAERDTIRNCKFVCNNKYCFLQTQLMFVRCMRFLKTKNVWDYDQLYEQSMMEACHFVVEQALDYRSVDQEAIIRLKDKIGKESWDIINEYAPQIVKITDNEGISFYNKHTDAWSIRYQYLIRHFNEKDIHSFYNQVSSLGNNMISKVGIARNIFFDTYNFLVPYNKEYALRLYLHYLNVKSASSTFKFKKISRKNAKTLFSNNKQEEQFNQICEKLLANNRLSPALQKLEELGIGDRRKIKLNINAIKEAGRRQNKVAKVLGEILEDEDISTPKEIVKEEALTTPKETTDNPKENLLQLFKEHSYNLNKEEVDIFARSHGIMKSQLIESINETYYEVLDDVLIEEDDEHYMMNEAYYEQIKG